MSAGQVVKATNPPLVREIVPWLCWIIVRLVTWWLLLILTRYQVNNKENTMLGGSLILVSNHLSWVDPFILYASLPRRISFMANDRLFRSRWRRIMFYCLSAFPANQGRYHQAYRVLGISRLIGIFPEGRRSSCGYLSRGHRGAAHIALRTGDPILPVAVTGTEKLKHINIFRRHEITVTIGQVFHLPATEGKLTSSQLQQSTDFIMRHISALLPESYRGVYR